MLEKPESLEFNYHPLMRAICFNLSRNSLVTLA